MSEKTTKQTILDTLEDLVSSFLYYDRKESETLPRGAIDEAVCAGEITEEEIISAFAEHLRSGLSEKATYDTLKQIQQKTQKHKS